MGRPFESILSQLESRAYISGDQYTVVPTCDSRKRPAKNYGQPAANCCQPVRTSADSVQACRLTQGRPRRTSAGCSWKLEVFEGPFNDRQGLPGPPCKKGP